MSKIYWDTETNNAVIRWKGANNLEQFHIYKQILPKILYMGRSILGKYFYVDNQTDREEILWSAIDHLFMRLDKFDPERKESAYSFCGTVLRRYMMDVCRQKKRILVVQIEYVDDLETEFEYSYSFNPFEDDNPYDFDALFQRLEGARHKLITYVNQKEKRPKSLIKGLKNEIVFIGNLQEFLFKYKDSQGLSRTDIHDAMINNQNISHTTINKYLFKHLGITAESVDKLYNKTENEALTHMTYIEDDYTPNQTRNDVHMHRKRMKERNE